MINFASLERCSFSFLGATILCLSSPHGAQAETDQVKPQYTIIAQCDDERTRLQLETENTPNGVRVRSRTISLAKDTRLRSHHTHYYLDALLSESVLLQFNSRKSISLSNAIATQDQNWSLYEQPVRNVAVSAPRDLVVITTKPTSNPKKFLIYLLQFSKQSPRLFQRTLGCTQLDPLT